MSSPSAGRKRSRRGRQPKTTTRTAKGVVFERDGVHYRAKQLLDCVENAAEVVSDSLRRRIQKFVLKRSLASDMRFEVSERVLVPQGVQLYEAQVVAVLDDAAAYEIHYRGWHRRYDEIVDAHSVFKERAATTQLKKQLDDAILGAADR